MVLKITENTEILDLKMPCKYYRKEVSCEATVKLVVATLLIVWLRKALNVAVSCFPKLGNEDLEFVELEGQEEGASFSQARYYLT